MIKLGSKGIDFMIAEMRIAFCLQWLMPCNFFHFIDTTSPNQPPYLLAILRDE